MFKFIVNERPPIAGLIALSNCESYKYLFDADYRNKLDNKIGAGKLSLSYYVEPHNEAEVKAFVEQYVPALYPEYGAALRRTNYTPGAKDKEKYLNKALSLDGIDVSVLGGVHTLDLSWTKVRDVSALGGLHTLDLSYTMVNSIEALGRVHTLILRCCSIMDPTDTLFNIRSYPLEDVRALSGVHTLDLSCTGVTDASVASLGDVTMLILAHTNISDVSALGNVRYLDLSYTRVRDVSALGNVATLVLYDTNVPRDIHTNNVIMLDLDKKRNKIQPSWTKAAFGVFPTVINLSIPSPYSASLWDDCCNSYIYVPIGSTI